MGPQGPIVAVNFHAVIGVPPSNLIAVIPWRPLLQTPAVRVNSLAKTHTDYSRCLIWLRVSLGKMLHLSNSFL